MTKFEQIILKYNSRLMADLGISAEQAAGIWGNISVETGRLTLLQEIKPTIKGSRGGWGWFQWTGPRRKAFESWAQARGYSYDSDEANYLFIIYETINVEKKSLVELRKTKTPEEAAVVFMATNLRPGVKHEARRKSEARYALEIIQKQAPIIVPEKKKDVITGPAIGTAPPAIAITYFWDNPHFWPIVIGVTLISVLLATIIHKHKNRKL